LILINGLAEQAESWYRNVDFWRQDFDVYTPNMLTYDGAELQRRIDAGQQIDIDYLVEQLKQYLDLFVQEPPYNLVASHPGSNLPTVAGSTVCCARCRGRRSVASAGCCRG